MIAFIIANKALILGALWGISELLAVIPMFKSNSVFEAIYNAIKSAKDALSGK